MLLVEELVLANTENGEVLLVGCQLEEWKMECKCTCYFSSVNWPLYILLQPPPLPVYPPASLFHVRLMLFYLLSLAACRQQVSETLQAMAGAVLHSTG